MKPLQKSTLLQLCDELAAHPWPDCELDELVDPKLGIITGFQDLLRELDELRQTDLGVLPPAQGVRAPDADP
jgi:hypothetical protein